MHADKNLAIFICVCWQVSSYLYSFLVTSIKLSFSPCMTRSTACQAIVVCGWWLHWSLCVDGDCVDHCVWMVTALIVVCGWWLRWSLFVDGDCVDRCLWMVTALIVVCGWWLRWSLWMVTALIIVCGWWLCWSLWMVTVAWLCSGLRRVAHSASDPVRVGQRYLGLLPPQLRCPRWRDDCHGFHWPPVRLCLVTVCLSLGKSEMDCLFRCNNNN